MGCDIHLFVEYRKDTYQENYWRSFGGEFRLERHYGVFSSLAGVRNYGDVIKPVVEPRGIPRNAGYSCLDEYRYYITDNITEANECNLEKAEQWVNSGISEWWDERKTFVTDPDAHSGSWLSLQELKEALAITWKEDGETKSFRDIEDYNAVIAAMECLESQGMTTRVVFWFDN